MKARLHLSIDREVILSSKVYAKHRGMSLSALVESFLRDAVEAEEPGFAEKWRGRFHVDDPENARMTYLKKRYGL